MSIPLSKGCCGGTATGQSDANPDGYVTKGSFETVDKIKTYVTGPAGATASHAIVFVYDIFGFKPQTLRGADLLSTLTGATVYMPDLWGEHAIPVEEFPPETEEQKARVAAFFAGPGALEKNKKKVYEMASVILKDFPNVKAIAGFGLCWGGKIVLNAGNIPLKGEDGHSVFVATAQAHPTQLTTEDAEGLTIPHLILPTKDEDKKVIEEYEAVEKPAGCETHWFPDMIHGFMGARGKLSDPNVMQKYTEGYRIVSNWLWKYLQ